LERISFQSLPHVRRGMSSSFRSVAILTRLTL
jgi:hypothetical protein